MGFKAVADAKVWTALVDLLTVGTDEPNVRFSFEEGLWTRLMGLAETVAYEVHYPTRSFEEFECTEPVYVKLYRDSFKSILRKAKGRVELTVRGEDVLLAGEPTGKTVSEEEFKAKVPPEIRLRFVNKCVGDAYRLRRWLWLVSRAIPGDRFIAFSGRETFGKVHVVAFDWKWGSWLEYPFESSTTEYPSTSFYSLDMLLACLPPSAVAERTRGSIKIYTADADDRPLYAETEGLFPEGVEYRFWLAPYVDSREAFLKKLEEALPVTARAVVSYERADLFFDMLQSNVDEPEILFDLDGLKARNVDMSYVTLLEVKAEPVFFIDYHSPKPIYALLRREKKQIDALVDIAKLLEEDVQLTVSGDVVYIWRCRVGEVKPEKEQKFEAPEVKLELKSWIELDNREFASLMREWVVKMKATYLTIAHDKAWLGVPRLYFTGVAGDIVGEVEVTPSRMHVEEDRVASSHRAEWIMQFLPPSALRVRFPLTLLFGMAKPLIVEFTPYDGLDFKAYVSPDTDIWRAVTKHLGWIKTPTEEDVLSILRERAPEPLTKGAIETILMERLYDIEKVEEILRKLVEEKKLVEERKGWADYYRLPEYEPKLKPLTEEVVLEAIGELCSLWNTDSVGYLELETVLGKEYDIKPLHDILVRLREKGLVDFKAWPERRRGYAVDMRGYWYLKPTKPEEAVKKAEEVKKLKELTKEAVLSTIEKLHGEVGGEVRIASILERLRDEGYDTTKIDEVLAQLKAEGRIELLSDGRIWTAEWARKVREELEKKPPPVPAGYAIVRFKRDMVRFMGTEKPPKMYGPFKAGEEAVIPVIFADAFEKAGYVEVLARGGGHSSAGSEPAFREGLQSLSSEAEAGRVKIPPELEDLAEIARRESLDEFMYHISVTRTRPYSRIAAICRESFITLEDVCSKGPTEPPYSQLRILYDYAKPWCDKAVTVYRGGSDIKPGDWVALERGYAEFHGTPVYELKVSPGDVVWAGTYEKEWYYIPKHLQGLFKSAREFWKASRSAVSESESPELSPSIGEAVEVGSNPTGQAGLVELDFEEDAQSIVERLEKSTGRRYASTYDSVSRKYHIVPVERTDLTFRLGSPLTEQELKELDEPTYQHYVFLKTLRRGEAPPRKNYYVIVHGETVYGGLTPRRGRYTVKEKALADLATYTMAALWNYYHGGPYTAGRWEPIRLLFYREEGATPETVVELKTAEEALEQVGREAFEEYVRRTLEALKPHSLGSEAGSEPGSKPEVAARG